jgi:hypothetical protein
MPIGAWNARPEPMLNAAGLGCLYDAESFLSKYAAAPGVALKSGGSRRLLAMVYAGDLLFVAPCPLSTSYFAPGDSTPCNLPVLLQLCVLAL